MRVRFAPSPTGYLHVGGARTALFNWLLARRHGGTFVLRIEDTDVERSSEEMVTGILDGLRWLGLTWDEGPDVDGPYGPYFQSERLERYRQRALELVEKGHAYFDYRTPAEAKAQREQSGQPSSWKSYSNTSLELDADEVARREAVGLPRAIRFRAPADGQTVFTDVVHGEIRFDNAQLEDFVVLRSDGHPTYHLSVVVDDLEMAITDVIRGDDHISNTPKHVLLYQAFDAPVPRFAHVPLILGTDKKRLSKRHGATSVMEYARAGYLPECMVNFLSLLGWGPGNDEELLTVDELIARFDLDGISGGNAVFNPEKLLWMNNQYIMRVTDDRLIALAKPLLEDAGLWRTDFADADRVWLQQALVLLRPRARRLHDIVDGIRPFVTNVVYDPAAVSKHLTSTTMPLLETLRDRLTSVQPFDTASIEQTVRGLADEHGIKASALMQSARVALTGRTESPGLFDVFVLLGRDEACRRLQSAAALSPAGL